MDLVKHELLASLVVGFSESPGSSATRMAILASDNLLLMEANLASSSVPTKCFSLGATAQNWIISSTKRSLITPLLIHLDNINIAKCPRQQPKITHEWDPITFTFTAAIGALALIVALITVFQGLLAAGPGRLKASPTAIGERHSRRAKTTFDWREFRYKTIVDVPFI